MIYCNQYGVSYQKSVPIILQEMIATTSYPSEHLFKTVLLFHTGWLRTGFPICVERSQYIHIGHIVSHYYIYIYLYIYLYIYIYIYMYCTSYSTYTFWKKNIYIDKLLTAVKQTKWYYVYIYICTCISQYQYTDADI